MFFLGNKQVSLFLNSLLLSPPCILVDDHLHALWGYPGPAQLFRCSRLSLNFVPAPWLVADLWDTPGGFLF